MIAHARGWIPNEVGPARCRATSALTSQQTRPASRPDACHRPVLAVCPLLDLVSGWPDGYTRGECRLPPLGLGIWVVRRLHSHGGRLPPDGLGWAGRGRTGGEVKVSKGRVAIESVRHPY